MNERDEELLFESLDSQFHNYNQPLTSYSLSSKDILIQWNFILEIPIISKETLLSYSFQTRNGDISFGLDFLPINGGDIEIISNHRVASDKETIIGTYKLINEGTAVLYWDNSFSWFAQKDLSYQITITQVIFFGFFFYIFFSILFSIFFSTF